MKRVLTEEQLERRRQRRRENYKRNPTPVRNYQLRKDFGINLKEYEELLDSQGGGCAICGRTPIEEGKALAVDHCHSTGTVRGLLCGECNRGIGIFADDCERLGAAVRYLQQRRR